MTRSNDPSRSNQDNKLADFTDQLLKGQVKGIESNVDQGLRDLEETIVHLKNTIPSASLDEAVAKQMLVRLNARVRRENNQAREPAWRKWLGQPRTQLIMASTLVALIIVLAAIVPGLTSSNSSTTATALTSSQDIVIVITLAGAILFIFWSMRRK
jgi:hypothetical protein